MPARSLNKVQLIGNLTRDPELRYTPQGTAVCTFGMATNRYWTTESGEKKEETEFHRIVAWNKLAEICAQLLTKGQRTYVEGRLQTRVWTGQDGTQRQTTEIVIEDMIVLGVRREVSEVGVGEEPVKTEAPGEPLKEAAPPKAKEPEVEEVAREKKKAAKSQAEETDKSQVSKEKNQELPEDLPF